MKVLFSNHAAKQMFKRMISTNEVKEVLEKGETIMNYNDDKPYPSKLLLAFINNRPIHVVSSYNKIEDITVIITTYEPLTNIWENDFKTRKK